MIRKNTKGFSILETMIASFVLIVGIVAAMELFVPIIQNSAQARERTVATTLAQEGVELVKNQRDNNMLANRDFYAGFGIGHTTSCIDYMSDTSSGSTHSCSGGELYRSGDWYRYSGGTSTLFRRKIRTSATDEEMVVTSYVVWRDGSFPSDLDNPSSCTLRNKCVFARLVLTDWR